MVIDIYQFIILISNNNKKKVGSWNLLWLNRISIPYGWMDRWKPITIKNLADLAGYLSSYSWCWLLVVVVISLSLEIIPDGYIAGLILALRRRRKKNSKSSTSQTFNYHHHYHHHHHYYYLGLVNKFVSHKHIVLIRWN